MSCSYSRQPFDLRGKFLSHDTLTGDLLTLLQIIDPAVFGRTIFPLPMKVLGTATNVTSDPLHLHQLKNYWLECRQVPSPAAWP